MNKILKIVRNRNGQAIVTSELGRSVGGGISIVSAIVSGAILWPCLASAQNFSDLTNNAATTTELTLAGKSLQSTVTVLSSSTASTTNALSTRATAIESSATALSTATSVSV